MGAIVFTFTANTLKSTLFKKADAPMAIVFLARIGTLSIFYKVKNNDNPFFRVAIVIFAPKRLL